MCVCEDVEGVCENVYLECSSACKQINVFVYSYINVDMKKRYGGIV